MTWDLSEATAELMTALDNAHSETSRQRRIDVALASAHMAGQQAGLPVGDLEERPIPATWEIVQFFHCRKCVEQGAAPQSIEVGWTQLGFQVWCKRHDVNIIHVDFQGVQHPANLGSAERISTFEAEPRGREEVLTITVDILGLVADMLTPEAGDPDWGSVQLDAEAVERWGAKWYRRAAQWSDEEIDDVTDWAAAVHLQASDNDVEIPPVPEVLKPYMREGYDNDC